MTKQKQSERDEAIARLRETLKPGDTVFTVLRSVSRSGMNRKIDLYKIEDGSPQWLSRLAAKACDWTFDNKRDAVSVGGCGMDVGFHLVYSLSRVLFHDAFTCTGKGCPSNDHNNAYYHGKERECMVCRKPVGDSTLTRRNGDSVHSYPVCSEACAAGEWQHSDGGYALKHRWL
jgi:hypothetical protein